MSKYSFDRIEPKTFEAMAQALLEKKYRDGGNLIQFGDGKDGGREATWTQPITHPSYVRPENKTEDVPKEWVFQVKYHDISQRGWKTARDTVIQELKNELDKITNQHKVPCHAYVMITNVPFTGMRNIGTRDQTTEITARWKQYIPEIYVWDAADLSCMLDADENVRTAYLDDVLPGDLLKAIYRGISFDDDRKKSAFKAYLKYVIRYEKSARADEAGDEQNLLLTEVFIDFTLKLLEISRKLDSIDQFKKTMQMSELMAFDASSYHPNDCPQVRASSVLFFLDYERILLLGGPGLGKSTLTQFLSLYQAARLIEPTLAKELAKRLKLPKEITAETLDSYITVRFPFRIELRRYANWMSEQESNEHPSEIEIARYIAEVLINKNASSNLTMNDIFGLASKDPILLVLDGLDEVPNQQTRQKIVDNLIIFVNRIEAENGNLQIIMSSRPNGYSGEFNEFDPCKWEVNELQRSEFNEYCEKWLTAFCATM